MFCDRFQSAGDHPIIEKKNMATQFPAQDPFLTDCGMFSYIIFELSDNSIRLYSRSSGNVWLNILSGNKRFFYF